VGSSRPPTRPRPTPRRPTPNVGPYSSRRVPRRGTIISQAQTTADQIVVGATAEGQGIHDRIVASAEAEVVVARQAAVEEVTARVGEIVLAAAERVVGREIKAADHQDLINEAIAAVRAEGTGAASVAGGAR